MPTFLRHAKYFPLMNTTSSRETSRQTGTGRACRAGTKAIAGATRNNSTLPSSQVRTKRGRHSSAAVGRPTRLVQKGPGVSVRVLFLIYFSEDARTRRFVLGHRLGSQGLSITVFICITQCGTPTDTDNRRATHRAGCLREEGAHLSERRLISSRLVSSKEIESAEFSLSLCRTLCSFLRLCLRSKTGYHTRIFA